MAEAITLNDTQRQVMEDDASLQQFRSSPGAAVLARILNAGVQGAFLSMLSAGTTDELLDHRGQARAYMALMEKLDAVHGEAVQIAARLRSEIEQHREREQLSLMDEQERRQRSASSASLEGSGQFR